METIEKTVTGEVSLETIPPSAKAAKPGMSFEELNFQAIITDVASRKSSNGHTVSFVSKKGKMTLFSGVAAACKSQASIGNNVRLNDEQVEFLNYEIAKFWHNQSEALIAEGYVQTGLRKHVPTVIIDIDDKRVSDVHWKATQTLIKHSTKENLLIATLRLGELKKQQVNMLAQLNKYERKDHALMALRIELVENYIKQLSESPVKP